MSFTLLAPLVLLVHVASSSAASASSLDEMTLDESMKLHGLLSRAAADRSRQSKGSQTGSGMNSASAGDYPLENDASDRLRRLGTSCSDKLDKCRSKLEVCKAEAEQPTLLFTQMARTCKLKRKADGDGETYYEWSSKDMDDDTYVFSDRPYQIAYTMTTESFVDDFDDTFSKESGGKPNGAITFRHENTGRFEGPLISVLVEAARKSNVGKFVYELRQSRDQEEVNALDDFFKKKDGDDVVEYEMCTLFIDAGGIEGGLPWSLAIESGGNEKCMSCFQYYSTEDRAVKCIDKYCAGLCESYCSAQTNILIASTRIPASVGEYFDTVCFGYSRDC